MARPRSRKPAVTPALSLDDLYGANDTAKKAARMRKSTAIPSSTSPQQITITMVEIAYDRDLRNKACRVLRAGAELLVVGSGGDWSVYRIKSGEPDKLLGVITCDVFARELKTMSFDANLARKSA